MYGPSCGTRARNLIVSWYPTFHSEAGSGTVMILNTSSYHGTECNTIFAYGVPLTYHGKAGSCSWGLVMIEANSYDAPRTGPLLCALIIIPITMPGLIQVIHCIPLV